MSGNGAKAIVVAEMLFASRVRGVAGAVGVEVRVSRPPGVVPALRESGARLLLVDLETPGGRGVEAIRAVRSAAGLEGVRIVAFSSHTNAAAIEEGRTAGADRVVARSAFVQMLPALLGGESG